MHPKMVNPRPKVATASANHCPGPGAARCRELPQGQLEHEVRRPYPNDAAGNLGRDVERRDAGRQLAAPREGEAYGRIEVCARHRPEGQDQDGEDRAGRDRVAKERQRAVPARELQSHDARANDGREEEGGSGRSFKWRPVPSA